MKRSIDILEEWRQSEEFPNYEISDEGKVRNQKTGRVLKASISEKGYARVSLAENGKTYTRNIHRLVADVYVPGYEEGMGVVHKDNDPSNNHADNLKWETKSEIARRSFENGRQQTHRMRPVRCIETGEEFESVKSCAISFNKSRRSISRSANNPASHTREGYHFEPLD